MYTVFILALVLFGMGFSSLVGGNAFLSIYLLGILMGNSSIRNKKEIIPFFDGVTGLSQIVIFFLLGLLSFPHKFPYIIGTAIVIALFILLIARPLTVLLILKPFHCSLNQCLLVSWAGLRGASSIVFSIFAMAAGNDISRDLFHIVFMISLLSVAVQGTLLPYVSRKLDMIDDKADVQKTFNDYQEEESISFVKFHLFSQHPYVGKCLKEITLPPKLLVVVLIRGKEVLVPNGDTCLQAGDLMIAAAEEFEDRKNMTLREITVDKNHKWKGRSLSRIPMQAGTLIVMIRRGKETVIPTGNTVVYEGDVLVQAKF